ncbi:MAG: hypothetical protein JWL97_3819 [Gemmatimonadales bacterium]|jgi:hypothetical protein|nr:hypothetical protein [Gemmatimonadales bacterium]
MADHTSTCPLDELQIQVLRRLLSVSFDGVEELRRQISMARMSGEWSPNGSASFDIYVPPGVPQSKLVDGPAPIEAQVLDVEGRYLGELILWITGGRISALEYAWITDAPPTCLPNVGNIHVAAAR